MSKETETIRIRVTHTASFYKTGQKYKVHAVPDNGRWRLASNIRQFISVKHAKQIPVIPVHTRMRERIIYFL